MVTTVVETLAGSGSWTAPLGIVDGSVRVQCWGAGGGGARAGRAGGGGGGAYAESTISVTTGQVVPYSAPTGGAARTTNGTGNAPSGDTSFGSPVLVSAERGYGGGTTLASFGQNGRASLSTGTIKYDGGAGGITNGTVTGSGGGGSATPTGAGSAAPTVSGIAGAGGASGSTPGGAADNPGTSAATGGSGGGGSLTGSAGAAGAPGGGGGGAANSLGTSGKGGDGVIIITYQLATVVTETLTGSGWWVAPPNLTGNQAQIVAWGPGASGSRGSRAYGGGGGAVAAGIRTINPGDVIYFSAPSGGVAKTSNGAGNDGNGVTTFASTPAIIADYGRGAGTSSGGVGGQAANSTGDTVFSGGDGGAASGTAASGGGGAATASGAGTTAVTAAGIAGAGGASGSTPGGAADNPGTSAATGGSGGGGSLTGSAGSGGNPGGGGGGAGNSLGSSGTGGDGQLLITYTTDGSTINISANANQTTPAPSQYANALSLVSDTYPMIWNQLSSISPEWADPNAPVLLTVVYGQSRANNHAEGWAICYPPTTTAQQRERCLMGNNPRAPGALENFVPSSTTAFVPLKDCYLGNRAIGYPGNYNDPLGQSLSQALWTMDGFDIDNSNPLRRRILIVCGIGSQSINTLKKNGNPYINPPLVPAPGISLYDRLLSRVQRTVDLVASLYGQNCRVESVFWLQGEADYNRVTRSEYATTLKTGIIDPLRTDLAAITGDNTPFEFILDQVPSRPDGAANIPALAQIDVARANQDGHTWMVGPAYQMPFNVRETPIPDGVDITTAHMSSFGVTAWGEAFGRTRNTLSQGGAPNLCYVDMVSRNGNVITLTCDAPGDSMVIDTSTMPDPGNYGFKLRDPGGAVITSVAVSNFDIIVTLDKDPQPGATLEYAHENPSGIDPINGAGVDRIDGMYDMSGVKSRTPGSWGNLRASLGIECTGLAQPFTLYPWLCTDKWLLP